MLNNHTLNNGRKKKILTINTVVNVVPEIHTWLLEAEASKNQYNRCMDLLRETELFPCIVPADMSKPSASAQGVTDMGYGKARVEGTAPVPLIHMLVLVKDSIWLLTLHSSYLATSKHLKNI